MSYNIPLDSSGDADFTGTMRASAFVGDGSGLINLPSAINGVDETGDYTWTGDHTFNGSVAFTGDTSLNMGSFVQNVIGVEGDTDRLFIENSVSTLNAGTPSESTTVWTRMVETGAETSKDNAWRVGLKDSWGMYFNKSGFIIQQGSAFKIGAYDAGAGGLGFVTTAFDLGLDSLRWPKVWGVNASFNGTFDIESGGSQRIYNLGTDGDTDTEYLEIEGDTSIGYYKIQPKYTGAGRAVQTLRLLAVQGSHLSLYGGGQFAYTHAGVQHLHCDAGGVSITDLNVSGTVTAPSVFNSNGGTGITINANDIRFSRVGQGEQIIMETATLRPIGNDVVTLGNSLNRWSDVYSVDGSFSGNLNVEVGGSQKFYNLGAEGDTDTEFVSMGWGNNDFSIVADSTGSGTRQDIIVAGQTVSLKYWSGTGFSTRIQADSSSVKVYRSLYAGTDGLYSCGLATNRWSNVASVDGDFSGTITTNTIESDAAAGSMFIKSSSTSPIYISHNGALTFSFYNTTFQPQNDDAVQLGTVTKRWSQGHFANVYSVNGDFSGRVLTTRLENVAGSSYIRVSGQTSSPIKLWRNTAPQGNNAFDMGADAERFRTVYSVDGSFSGNLNVEVGGSQRVYNLGAEGDADTEALVVSADGTTYDIFSTITGTGAHRRIDIGGFVGVAYRGLRLDTTNGIFDWQYNNATKFKVDGNTCNISTTTTVVNDLRPSVTGTSDNGTTALRWANVASVNGDFSGTVTANSFVGDGSQLTNLPAGGSVDTGADFTWTGEHVFEEGLKFNNLYSEIGGSFKLYNLGGVGDTDTEYLDISATANEFFISPKTTGAGSGRDLFVTGSYGSTRAHLEFQNNGNLKIAYGSNANILVGSTYVKLRANVDPNVDNTYTLGTSSIKWSTGYFYTLDAQTGVKANSWEGRGFANMFIQNPDDFPIYVKHNNNNSYIISSTELSPMSNNSKNCGSTTNRWANVNTVDLNASGTITLADVLNQTTDPAVAGQLWNDSGAIKISAG